MTPKWKRVTSSILIGSLSQSARAQAVRAAAIAEHIEQFRAEQEAAHRRVGISGADFDREWPRLLRAHQIAEAERDPLASEKQRIRALGDYTM